MEGMAGPLRDDHDAALARADALQVELDVQRKQDEALQAELADAKEQLAAARARLAQVAPESEPVVLPPRRPMAGLAALGGLIMVGGLLAASHSQQPDDPAPFQPIDVSQGELAALHAQIPPMPLHADLLVVDGLAQEVAGQPVAELVARDVRLDGTLDPGGRVEIWIAKPDATSHTYGTSWSSTDGQSWTGAAITTPIAGAMTWPTCSISDVLRRYAPDDHATVTARWTGDVWRWTYEGAQGAPATFDDDCGH